MGIVVLPGQRPGHRVLGALARSRPGIRLPDHAERGLRSQVGGAVEIDLDARSTASSSAS
jgi:hypothetical protein